MRNYKKYLAAALAATMVVGSSVVANAAAADQYVSSSDVTLTGSNAAGTIGGTGSVEGTAEKDVFTVVVPACMTGNDTAFDGFTFVLDPQKLITATNGSRYTTGSNAVATSIVPNKTLYFINKTSGIIDDTSDLLKVTNKSSMDVQINLDAEVSGAANIPMSANKTFASDTTTSMYLALKDAAGEKAIVKDDADNKNKAHKDDVIQGSPNAYEIKETNGTYEYVLKENVDESSFDTYEFSLTGACNGNEDADWAALPAGNTPAVVITWTIDPYEVEDKAPSVTTKTIAKPAGSDLNIVLDLGSGDLAASNITSLTFTHPTNGVKTVQPTNYTVEDGKLIIKESFLTNVTQTLVFTVTFDDDDTTTDTFTITV